ncbi:hypothetical protein [Pedobacter sp. ASV28]|uniref:hypothetical protein n=1 Tax=Pedobacter sp. ASV28 TaxID=2795123 RepID=UPI0018ECAACE|nr:hypothetical protein [Pedobacter sp. ASV28]
MDEQIIINTNAAGKNLYETTNETYGFYQERLDSLNRWIADLDIYESLDLKYQTGQNFQTLKGLYSLDALVTIASVDLSITTTELYLTKNRLKQIFYMKQVYLIVYEAYDTYNSKKQFLRSLINISQPELAQEFNAIALLERNFIKDFKLNTLIKNVRHKVAGHINKDFRLWYDTVTSLDPQYTADMAIAFLKAFMPLQQLTMKLSGIEHDKFLKYSAESNKAANKIIDKIENLMIDVNSRQPEELKLNLDIQAARDLLK